MDSGKLITLGVLGVGLWALYEWLVSQCETPSSGFYGGSVCQMLIGTPLATATAPISTTPVTTTSTTTTATTVPPSLNTVAAQMQISANSNSFVQQQGGQADAYQWSTIWNGVGQTPLPDVNALFYPNGIVTGTPNGPGLSSQGLPLMTLATFLATVQANGLSGMSLGYLSNFASSRVPGARIHGGWI